MELKGSKTEQNLMTAFAGESQDSASNSNPTRQAQAPKTRLISSLRPIWAI